jgi:VIT1/CCC1 family predicted Fe2+/Mn2+ transporter
MENHFRGNQNVRDIVIGMSDGLTVPFALAAGLSGAVADTRLIVIAGLAEIAAGTISMGLGGYLAGKNDAEHYEIERRREHDEVRQTPEEEKREVQQIFESFGLKPEEAAPAVVALSKRPDDWVDFMMRFELGLEAPDPKRALASGVTIGGAYALGGIIPLLPYMIFSRVRPALAASILFTLLALALFGFIKGRATGGRAGRSSLETAVVGGLAAAAAFGLARLVS